jgi:hypothetical protein
MAIEEFEIGQRVSHMYGDFAVGVVIEKDINMITGRKGDPWVTTRYYRIATIEAHYLCPDFSLVNPECQGQESQVILPGDRGMGGKGFLMVKII